jgi:hypothetical protein
MFDYGTPTYMRSYGADPASVKLLDGYWFHPNHHVVYYTLAASPTVTVSYNPRTPQSDAGIVVSGDDAYWTRVALSDFGWHFGRDRSKAVAMADAEYAKSRGGDLLAPPGAGMKNLAGNAQKKPAPASSKPAAPKAPAAPAAPTYVPVPTSPSTALVPAPGKTGGAPAGLTQKPWFWPAVAGGGILVLLGLYAALRGKKGSKKAPAPAAPAAPASRFKF